MKRKKRILKNFFSVNCAFTPKNSIFCNKCVKANFSHTSAQKKTQVSKIYARVASDIFFDSMWKMVLRTELDSKTRFEADVWIGP